MACLLFYGLVNIMAKQGEEFLEESQLKARNSAKGDRG
jgi:hypothetical protein